MPFAEFMAVCPVRADRTFSRRRGYRCPPHLMCVTAVGAARTSYMTSGGACLTSLTSLTVLTVLTARKARDFEPRILGVVAGGTHANRFGRSVPKSVEGGRDDQGILKKGHKSQVRFSSTSPHFITLPTWLLHLLHCPCDPPRLSPSLTSHVLALSQRRSRSHRHPNLPRRWATFP